MVARERERDKKTERVCERGMANKEGCHYLRKNAVEVEEKNKETQEELRGKSRRKRERKDIDEKSG